MRTNILFFLSFEKIHSKYWKQAKSDRLLFILQFLSVFEQNVVKPQKVTENLAKLDWKRKTFPVRKYRYLLNLSLSILCHKIMKPLQRAGNLCTSSLILVFYCKIEPTVTSPRQNFGFCLIIAKIVVNYLKHIWK